MKGKLDKAMLISGNTRNMNVSVAKNLIENANTSENIATGHNLNEDTNHVSDVTNHETGSESDGTITSVSNNLTDKVGLLGLNIGGGPQASLLLSQTSVSFLKTKLHKLTLPKLKGQVTKWGSFWDSYSSAIHNNNEISKIGKFNYLNSLLEGTGVNYDSVIEILKDRLRDPST